MAKTQIVKIQDICSVSKGQQIKTSLLNDKAEYKYINGGIKESGFYDKFNTTGKNVLISEGGASCGYVNYIEEPFWCGCHCYKLTDIKLHPKYLYFNLKANQSNIMNLRSGICMPNIKKGELTNLQLKIHLLKEEQLKITNTLENIEQAIKVKEEQLKALDELIQSRFTEMFGDPISNSKGFPTTQVINVVTLQRGFDLPIQARISTGKIPVYGSNGIVGTHNESKINCGVITGRSGTLGKVYYSISPFWPLNTTLFSNNTHGNNVVYLKYLLEFYNLQRFGSGIGVPTLNRNEFHNMPIIDVPVQQQNQFAEFVRQVEKAKEIVKIQIRDLQELLFLKMDEYFK